MNRGRTAELSLDDIVTKLKPALLLPDPPSPPSSPVSGELAKVLCDAGLGFAYFASSFDRH